MGRICILNHPLGKTIFFFLGFMILSIVAFQGTIVFWPQDNRFESVQIDIPKGASLLSISNSLKNQHILTNEKTFLMAVKLLGHETKILTNHENLMVLVLHAELELDLYIWPVSSHR
mgnify:CR=1 FL=1